MQTKEFKGTARAVVKHGAITEFSYHRTAVVIHDADKATIRLDSGGYRTATTKRAMNQASNEYCLGFRVWQKKGEWFVHWPARGEGFEDVAFFDGMILDRVPVQVAA